MNKFDIKTHKRHWISTYSKIKISLPPLTVQKEIVALMELVENIEKQIKRKKDLTLQLSKSLSDMAHYQ